MRASAPLAFLLLGAVLLSVAASSTAHAQAAPTITYPAGTYTLTFPSGVTIVTTANSITFSWATPAPTPTPTPAPIPVPVPPAPAPVPTLTGHVWALAVYDPASPNAVATSATLKASALELDVDWLPHAKNDAAVASWLPDADRVGYPALLLIQTTAPGVGKAVYAVKLPASENEAMAILQQARGRH